MPGFFYGLTFSRMPITLFPRLSVGNTKLGKILNWNLPARVTCPGKSEYCETVCYACTRLYKYENVKESYKNRRKARNKPGWVNDMIARINASETKVVRIHASGDFDSLKYINNWNKIVQGCPGTTFYFYTRSWVVENLLEPLKKLAREPNMFAWFSCDRSMPVPPKPANVRLAYMFMDDFDEPKYKVDLVFRVKHKTVRKRMGQYSSLVCPVEQGVDSKVQLTCEKCKICFSNYKTIRQPRNLQNATVSNRGLRALFVHV